MTATPATGSDTQAPTVPGTPFATACDGQNSVAFTTSTDNVAVTRYWVYSSADNYATPVATGATSPIVAPAPNDTAVTYQVAAYDAAVNQSAKSSASNSVTLTATWAAYTSDTFTGGPVTTIYNRASDAGAGSTTKTYTMGSSIARLGIDSDGRLVQGSAPVVVTAGFSTGFTDARASIKIVTMYATTVSASLATLFCARSGTGAAASSPEIVSQINRTTTGATARNRSETRTQLSIHGPIGRSSTATSWISS